jgi:hypothetical protein
MSLQLLGYITSTKSRKRQFPSLKSTTLYVIDYRYCARTSGYYKPLDRPFRISVIAILPFEVLLVGSHCPVIHVSEFYKNH